MQHSMKKMDRKRRSEPTRRPRAKRNARKMAADEAEPRLEQNGQNEQQCEKMQEALAGKAQHRELEQLEQGQRRVGGDEHEDKHQERVYHVGWP